MNRRVSGLWFIGLLFLSCIGNSRVVARSYSAKDSIDIMRQMKEINDSIHVNNKWAVRRSFDLAETSRALAFNYGIAKALQVCAFTYSAEQKFDSAIALSGEAIKIAASNNFNNIEIDAYVVLGNVYRNLGDFKSSVEQYKQALKLCSPASGPGTMMSLYGNFGSLMLEMQDLEAAKMYQLKALALAVQINSPKDMAMRNLHLASISVYQKAYGDAFGYIKRCIAISDSIHFVGLLGSAYEILARYYTDSGKHYDSALLYYNRSVSIFTKVQDNMHKAQVLFDLGNLYFLFLNNPRESEKNFRECKELAIKNSNIILLGDCEHRLATLYARNGDFKKAYEQQANELELNDSLYNKEKIAASEALSGRISAVELENKNVILRQEANIQKLRVQHRDMLLYGGGAFIVLLFASGFLLIRHNKLRTNQQLMQLEQKQLLAQINPHFIFNCLNSVQQFVVQNDIENANKYLADFAMLMRQTLDNSEWNTILLSRELEYLENYLSLESMRFVNLFSYKISCSDDIDVHSIEIPSMTIQPYVENAINHGLTNLEGKSGTLNINFYKKDGSLFCEVDDNGVGMKRSEEIKKKMFIKHESKGMEMTRLRLSLVSKLNGINYQVSIVDKTNATGQSDGTTIIIKFPLKT